MWAHICFNRVGCCRFRDSVSVDDLAASVARECFEMFAD